MSDHSKPARSASAGASRGRAASRFARLLVGYDGSDSATAAAAFALGLAGAAHAELTLLHASPTPETAPSADLLPAAAEQVVAYEARWQRRLESLRHHAGQDVPVTCLLERGNPAGALIATAIRMRADLLLTGSRGVGHLRGAVLGSVSTQLLTHAPCSVMIFGEGDRLSPADLVQSVVVGIDGSPSSAYALQLGQALSEPLGARLVLAHAYDPLFWFKTSPTTGMRDELRRHGRTLLDAARSALTVPPDRIDERLVEGNARSELATVCDELAPALLVVGSRGLGGFKAMLVGSTSRSLADSAPCPVLVARVPESAGRD